MSSTSTPGNQAAMDHNYACRSTEEYCQQENSGTEVSTHEGQAQFRQSGPEESRQSSNLESGQSSQKESRQGSPEESSQEQFGPSSQEDSRQFSEEQSRQSSEEQSRQYSEEQSRQSRQEQSTQEETEKSSHENSRQDQSRQSRHSSQEESRQHSQEDARQGRQEEPRQVIEEKEWDGRSIVLEEGLLFKTRSAAKQFVKKYGKSVMCKMSITDGGASEGCKSKKIVWSCTYGHEKPSAATDCRPIQHTKKKDCTAYIRFYCRGNKTKRDICVLKSFSEEHNHDRSRSMHKQDADKIEASEEIDSVKDALFLNSTAGQVQKLMRNKFYKNVTTKHARYTMKKLNGPDLEREHLAAYLEQIELDGGMVDVLLDNNTMVRGLVVQTVEMRKAYIGAKPSTIMVDTTHNFETSGYRLSAVCYCNPVSGRGEVGQLVFLADESAECYKFAFDAFKKTTNRDPENIVIDKDFTEMQVLKETFVNSRVLLCHFHVLKWWKGLVNSAITADQESPVLRYDDKKYLLESFRGLVYAHTENEYSEKLKAFEDLADGVQVKVGTYEKAKYVDLNHYFSKNWASCVDMWATHRRNSIPGLANINTNNHIERFWRTLKQFLAKMTPGDTTIYKAVLNLVQFCEERLEEKYNWDKRHKMRLYDKDPDIREEYSRASAMLNDKGMLRFKESIDMMRKKEECLEVCETEHGGVQERFKKKPDLNINKTAEIDKDESTEIEDMDLDLDEEIEFIDSVEAEDRNDNVKVYRTDVKSCNCKWRARMQAPCRHILFLRKRKHMILFDMSLFSTFYSKDRNNDLDRDNLIVNDGVKETNDNIDLADTGTDEINDNIDLEDDFEEPVMKTLTMGERFKLLSPLCDRLLDAMTRCGTKCVEMYSKELERCIVNVKNGKSLFTPEEHASDKVAEQEVMEEAEDNVSEDREDVPAAKKFDLNWQPRTKHGKVGRPKVSKVAFKEKKDGGKKSKEKGKKKEFKTTGSIVRPEETPIVCSFPPNHDRPRQGAVHVGDYCTLAPHSFLSNALVDFQVRYLQPDGPANKAVWLLSNELAQQLTGRWWESPTLCSQLEAARLYSEHGSTLVVMPWCECSHFFTVVGVCGPQDYIFIMESIGGYHAPQGASILEDFLKGVRATKGWAPVDTVTVILDSPKQSAQSNNCGLFMLETIRKILLDPEDFLARAQNNSIFDWYPPSQVSGRRQEMAQLLEKLGEEQRLPGNLLDKEAELDLPDLWTDSLPGSVVMKTKVKVRKSRKCGLCRDSGHNRQKCPMRLNSMEMDEGKGDMMDEEECATENIDSIKNVDTDDTAKVPHWRYLEFIQKLAKCTWSSANSDYSFLTMAEIRRFFDESGIEGVAFSHEEIDTCIGQMEVENKILTDDETVYFI